jgi:bifunctional oligoribonuclease and PAP phosphatase NrnA
MTDPPGGADEWSTNTTIEALASWLAGCRRVVVTTHVKPDGDAVGSTLALTRAINLAGGDAVPWYFGPMPVWATELIGPTRFSHVHRDELPAGEPEGIVLLDTGAWAQLEEIADWLRARADRVAVVDHHLHGDGDVGRRKIVDVSAAAVCELTAGLCVRVLGLPGPERLPKEVAEPLFVGLATDTGWFRHSNVTPNTLRLAASLMEAEIDQPRLFQMIEQSERPSRLCLMARALSSLELLDDGRVALMTLRHHDFHDCKAESGDSGGFAELALSIGSVRVAVVLTETFQKEGQSPLTKLSLRSKAGKGPDDSVDVNELARRFGGGGHARAAGARIQAPLEQARAGLLEALA